MDDTPEAPRDLRRELTNALRRCTPKQRRYLDRVRAGAGQKWSAAVLRDPKTNGILSKTSIRKWLSQERVQKVLGLHAEMAEAYSDLTAERILREYERLAFSDMRTMFDADGLLKPPHEWDDDAAAAVQGFDEKGRPKFHDKRGALDTAAKIRGVWVERLKHDHDLRVRDVSDQPLTEEEWERTHCLEASVRSPKGPG